MCVDFPRLWFLRHTILCTLSCPSWWAWIAIFHKHCYQAGVFTHWIGWFQWSHCSFVERTPLQVSILASLFFQRAAKLREPSSDSWIGVMLPTTAKHLSCCSVFSGAYITSPTKNTTRLPWAETEVVITFLKYPCFLKNSFRLPKELAWRKIKIIHTIWKQAGLKTAFSSKVHPSEGGIQNPVAQLSSFMGSDCIRGHRASFTDEHCKADCKVQRLPQKHLVLKKGRRS